MKETKKSRQTKTDIDYLYRIIGKKRGNNIIVYREIELSNE